MGEETNDLYEVEEFTRFAHQQRLVVLRPGQKIPLEQAIAYGLVKKPSSKKKDD